MNNYFNSSQCIINFYRNGFCYVKKLTNFLCPNEVKKSFKNSSNPHWPVHKHKATESLQFYLTFLRTPFRFSLASKVEALWRLLISSVSCPISRDSSGALPFECTRVYHNWYKRGSSDEHFKETNIMVKILTADAPTAPRDDGTQEARPLDSPSRSLKNRSEIVWWIELRNFSFGKQKNPSCHNENVLPSWSILDKEHRLAWERKFNNFESF